MANKAPVLVFVVALVLRLIDLGGPSFWLDEGFSLMIARKPIQEIWQLTQSFDIRPPLFYFGLSQWIQWVPAGEFWLRLPQVVAGALAVTLAFQFGRHLAGRAGGVCTACLTGTSHFLFLFEQECRMYAWVFLAESGYLLALALLMSKPTRKRALLLVASAALGSYMDYRFGLLAAIAGSYALLFVRPERRKGLFLSLLAGASVCLPLLPLFLHQNGASGVGSSLVLTHPPIELKLLASQIPALLGAWYLELSSPWNLAISLAVLLLLLGRSAKNPGQVGLVVCSFWGSWLFFLAYSWMRTPIYSLHSAVTLGYPFLLWLGLALASLPPKGRWLLLSLWILFNGTMIYRTHTDLTWNKQNWREIVAVLQSSASQQDQFVIVPAYQSYPFFYYWQPERWVTLNPRDLMDPKMQAGLLASPRSWFVLSGEHMVDRGGYVRNWMTQNLDIDQAFEIPNAPFYEICGESITVYRARPKARR